MSQEFDAQQAASRWISQWNSRDLEGVLESFADDAVFRSPKAKDIVGTSELVGKAALRAYWTKALERIGDLRFVLDHAAYDARREELFIVYVATLNGKVNRACERLRFSNGRVVDGEGLYGASA
jgi:ketosteroid isomerase-like protein